MAHLMGYAEQVPGRQQRGHDCVLRVRMDAAARPAQGERVPKERRARRLFKVERGPPEEDVVAIGRGVWQDEDVRRVYALFLHARRRDVHLIAW